MAHGFTIVGIGETLFDVFPGTRVLGGAPLNVAVHAQQLAAPLGGRGVVVSRVGQDELGTQALTELEKRGVSTQWMQTDPDHATGRAYVTLDPQGQPAFEIVANAAWDALQFDPDVEGLAQRCEAVCFGTLAQRQGQTRTSVQRFLDAAPQALRLFDANLRPGQYDGRVIRRSLELCNAAKFSQDELVTVAELLGLGAGLQVAVAGQESAFMLGLAQMVLRKYRLRFVVVTRGKDGTSIVDAAGATVGEPVSYPAEADADPVGAGDAVAAAVLLGMVLRWPVSRTVPLANHVGAFVASRRGALPVLPPEILAMVKD